MLRSQVGSFFSPLFLWMALCTPLSSPRADGPSILIDLADVNEAAVTLRRVYGSEGNGSFGVPVAGGHDVDGDQLQDYAFSAMLADPDEANAGTVYVVLWANGLQGFLDTAVPDPSILRIVGGGLSENSGSEIWIDDVTGDGIGDILVARQNYSLDLDPDPDRNGAGALSIVVGGPALRAQAEALSDLELDNPPAGVHVITFVGPGEYDRLGIWMRTGNVTGDAYTDILVAADQQEGGALLDETHAGAAYLIRGGPHLLNHTMIDLADFGSTPLAGNIARVTPPPNADHFHFGATCQIADLDGNGKGEVMAAAALERGGASLRAVGAASSDAHSTGGAPDGILYIAWDDNFTTPWTPGFEFSMSTAPGSTSAIQGGAKNVRFGEEILGGLDYDGDGNIDLFVGDIVADLSDPQNRFHSGSGHVFYNAAGLKGFDFSLDEALPPGVSQTTMMGGASGDIAGDTAAHADFDKDGRPDLMLSSPHANVVSRISAGLFHIFYGQDGEWPAFIDLAEDALPAPSEARIAVVYGALGTNGGDGGDTICYSAAAGDIDNDGYADLITNEMRGNGLAAQTTDVGNLIVLSGKLLAGMATTACNDGEDNDGDSLVDYPDDPGCGTPEDEVEDPECDDGIDNDEDGGADWNGAGGLPPDPECAGDGSGEEDPTSCTRMSSGLWAWSSRASLGAVDAKASAECESRAGYERDSFRSTRSDVLRPNCSTTFHPGR